MRLIIEAMSVVRLLLVMNCFYESDGRRFSAMIKNLDDSAIEETATAIWDKFLSGTKLCMARSVVRARDLEPPLTRVVRQARESCRTHAGQLIYTRTDDTTLTCTDQSLACRV